MKFTIKMGDLYLILIFAAMAISTFAKSYFNADGFLSPDSMNYLALAEILREGNSLLLPLGGNEYKPFASWPIGYPILILIVSKITGAPVFWASKILNVLLIGLTLTIFRLLFKQKAYLYGLIFFFSSYIAIYAYTCSETVFIFCLVWFSASVYKFMTKEANFFLSSFSLFTSSLSLFLSRYVGAFSLGVIGILGLYYFFIKKDMPKSAMLIAVGAANILLMFGYLYYNYMETGFATGIQRSPATETHAQLFIMLMKAIFAELIITTHYVNKPAVILFATQLIVLSYIIIKHREHFPFKQRSSVENDSISIAAVFALIGVLYLLSITSIRWLNQFDPIGYRFLAPGTFLLAIALINVLENRVATNALSAIAKFLVIFSILSLVKNVPLKIYRDYDNSTYSDTYSSVMHEYAGISKNSIVIFGHHNLRSHLKYLRVDIEVASPCGQFFKMTWPDFIKLISFESKRDIYLRIPDNMDSIKHCDESVLNIVKQYKKGSIVKLI